MCILGGGGCGISILINKSAYGVFFDFCHWIICVIVFLLLSKVLFFDFFSWRYNEMICFKMQISHFHLSSYLYI